jgi:hypothetical protein
LTGADALLDSCFPRSAIVVTATCPPDTNALAIPIAGAQRFPGGTLDGTIAVTVTVIVTPPAGIAAGTGNAYVELPEGVVQLAVPPGSSVYVHVGENTLAGAFACTL